MNLKKTSFCFLLFFLLTGCSDKKLEVKEPIDYEDKAKYGFGSFVKGKDSPIAEYSRTNSDKNGKDVIEVKKMAQGNSPKEKIWDATVSVLEEFSISFMDKKNGKIETEKAKIKQFDSTEECLYKVVVDVSNGDDIRVEVISSEDSSARLKKHAEYIKSSILSNLK
ncbi:MAG: hypothetical protein LBI95_04115 [Holosporales bacterium]|jgi:uncharacterized lipoprotein|nr:hypothetical protein [Holosporales bacterium]